MSLLPSSCYQLLIVPVQAQRNVEVIREHRRHQQATVQQRCEARAVESEPDNDDEGSVPARRSSGRSPEALFNDDEEVEASQ